MLSKPVKISQRCKFEKFGQRNLTEERKLSKCRTQSSLCVKTRSKNQREETRYDLTSILKFLLLACSTHLSNKLMGIYVKNIVLFK